MRTLIITAANEAFMPLLRGLVKSLYQWETRPFTDFACLDVGLETKGREWISQYTSHIVSPEWDLPIDSELRAREPYLRAITARPFLPDYFPGYDMYLWIDADAWVQERFALEWFISAAADGAMAIVPEVDRLYFQKEGVVNWRMSYLQRYFGQEAGDRLLYDMYLNSGIFALSGDAPHWKIWAKYFAEGLHATKGLHCSDQTAINHAIYSENLEIYPLPAICNWMCHLALPEFDRERQKFCEPLIPKNPLGIIHLTAKTKDHILQMQDDDMNTISLCYPGS